MIILWATAGILLAFGCELALGRIAPWATHYVALMTLPLVTYALRTSQRSSMAVGCASGLLEDYWLEPRLFGLNGLVKTILGWAAGGVGARFDLNNAWGRFGAGASVHLLDEALQMGLRRLFGEATAPWTLQGVLIRALCGGLLTTGVLAIVGKLGISRRARVRKQRKA